MNVEHRNDHSYAQKADALLSAWMSNKTLCSLRTLSELLGCNLDPREMHLTEQTTDEDEKIILATWLRVFECYDQAADTALDVENRMLAALLRNNRWRVLFDNADRARRFTASVASYFWSRTPDAGVTEISEGDIHYAMWVMLQEAMSDWIPPRPDGEVFTLRTLAIALFGMAWCTLVYDTKEASVTLAMLVEQTQPTFLPGRLSTFIDQEHAVLPDLNMTPAP